MVDESSARAIKHRFCVDVFKRPPEVATPCIERLSYYASPPIFSLQERPVLEPLDIICADCGGGTVPCWMCADDLGVPAQVPMTSQHREVRHVGICPRHGAVDAHCPASNHMPKPVDVQRPHLDPPGPYRAAAVGLLIGLILGMVLGAMFVAPALLHAIRC